MSASRHITIFFAIGIALKAMANPTGMTVASGSATTHASGSQLTITTGNRAVLNWQSFNIGAGETTVFNQPSASSLVVNNIHDANASQIYGSLQANGLVVLMNQNGFYFGPNSFVKTAGLIVSTANCLPPQNSGGSWEFNGPPPLSTIINYGQISVGKNGSVFLIADGVENHGTISAPDGSIGIASGQTVLLSERPDGRGMSMHVTLPSGSVDNYGTLVADAGTIAMQAKVVNQGGLIQANSVSDQNGVIELLATDNLNLGANSKIIANGDDFTSGSAGGAITLRSENNFSDAVGSQISVAGGSQGGNGGSVEVSAPNISSLNSSMNASAQSGWSGGTFFLDPVNITLDTSTANGAINVNTAFAGFSTINLQASGNITINANTTWDLSASTGVGSGNNQLILEAGGNITFGTGSQIFDANKWSVTLDAGYDFVNNVVQSGVGNIYLNGGNGQTDGGSIQTAQGMISLAAGQDITIGSGYVITTGGGSINAHALKGSIDTGSDAQGYHFNSSASSLNMAYDLSDGLGGVSTAAGGDVTLIAGSDVISVLPVSIRAGKIGYVYDGNTFSSLASSSHTDFSTAGSGAYGKQSGQVGNVTIVAGGNVTGNYLVANGTGSIYAGAKMDANGNPIIAKDANNNPIVEKDANGNSVMGAGGNPVYVYALNPNSTGSAGTDQLNPNLALNLISGGWNVAAAQDIFLQEVRNPNGVFDINGGAAFIHYFDYAPNDFVNLSAGNLVQLGASTSLLPRLNGVTVPIIYPSILNITAGAGGVILGTRTSPTSLTLFPSPQGSLTINTTDGGALIGNLGAVQGAPQLFNLIISDAGHSQYTPGDDFGLDDHAATPIHADGSTGGSNPMPINHTTPIELNISGNMQLVFLGVPESAQINVGGDMINCGFQGMNLSSDPGFPVQIQEADGSTRIVAVEPGITSINVTGDIFNRGNFTSIDLNQLSGAQAPDLSLLSLALPGPGEPFATTLATSFFFNGRTLTYQNIPGTTLTDVLNLLNQLTVQAVDKNGFPEWEDSPLDTIPKPNPVPVSILGNPTVPGTIAHALLTQFNALGAIPSTTSGYTIGGGGQFNISARTIDLGTSDGIQSEGVAFSTTAGLFGNGGVFDHGADVKVTTTGNHTMGTTATGNLIGDLDMFSSSIASLNGGDISINAGGDINAGSSVFNVSSAVVHGIYSTAQGDLSVIANGDINVNGSRIVTYDGGNITVESLNGNINAGTGASLPVSVTAYYEDPITHIVYVDSPQIPFSGIDTLTFPDRDAFYPAPAAVLGNILVETPNGDVNANVSGILQLPLNHLSYPNATATVLAGYALDNQGEPVVSETSIKTFGPTVELLDSGVPVLDAIGHPIFVTQVLDANGNPVFDASGHPLYVKDFVTSGGPSGGPVITYSFDGGEPSIQSYLNSAGDPVSIVEPLDANGHALNDSHGNPIFVFGENINANGSGIIASNAKLKATGNINGLIFARNNIDISAQQNVNVTALGIGNVNVSSAGGTISGTIVGVGSVSVSGSSIDASLISANVSGATSGSSGLGQGAAANTTSQSASSDDSNKTADKSDDQDDDDLKKKKNKNIALAQKISRVTVLLPQKN